MSQGGDSFGRNLATGVMLKACERLRLSSTDAELVRLGENAIFHIPRDGVVLRIGRSADRFNDAFKEVQSSQWLSSKGIPVCVTALTREQPILVGGHPVTIWDYIDGRRGAPRDVQNLGRILRQVHGLDEPVGVDLPRSAPLARVRKRIMHSRISENDREELLGAIDALEVDIENLHYPLARSVIHGDAHVQNLMVPANGRHTLIDLENISTGQPEWDLAVTATEWQLAGFWTDRQYRNFVAGYGYDVTDWGGFEILRRAQAIKMTTWLMQNVDESQDIREEYELRMRTIRDGEPLRCWTPF